MVREALFYAQHFQKVKTILGKLDPEDDMEIQVLSGTNTFLPQGMGPAEAASFKLCSMTNGDVERLFSIS